MEIVGSTQAVVPGMANPHPPVVDDARQRQAPHHTYTHGIKRTPPEQIADEHERVQGHNGSTRHISSSNSINHLTAEMNEPTVVGSGTDAIRITSKKHKTDEQDCLHEFYVSKGLHLHNGQYGNIDRETVELVQDDSAAGATMQTVGEDAQNAGLAPDDSASPPTQAESLTESDPNSQDDDIAPSATSGPEPVDFDALLKETIDGIPAETDLEPETISFSSQGNKISGPRNYQQELTQLAKSENVIAFLETGSGKTFIAVMLIKELVAPRALAYSALLDGEYHTSCGVVTNREEMKKSYDAKLKIAIAARKGKGLSMARRLHMEQFGASQAGSVVPTDIQLTKVVNAMIKTIVRGVEQSPEYEQPRPEEISQICSHAIASGILDKLTAKQEVKVSPETSDSLRVADHKMVVFLVPRVPLVSQQAEVIRLNTELDVGEYCGEHRSDHFNANAWDGTKMHQGSKRDGTKMHQGSKRDGIGMGPRCIRVRRGMGPRCIRVRRGMAWGWDQDAS
eukprot:COSAG02_NODE_6229_length_3711_cov_49.018549_1_plen_509_part_10